MKVCLSFEMKVTLGLTGPKPGYHCTASGGSRSFELTFTVFSLRFCLEALDDAEVATGLIVSIGTLLFVLASEMAFGIVRRKDVTRGQRRCGRNKGDLLGV